MPRQEQPQTDDSARAGRQEILQGSFRKLLIFSKYSALTPENCSFLDVVVRMCQFCHRLWSQSVSNVLEERCPIPPGMYEARTQRPFAPASVLPGIPYSREIERRTWMAGDRGQGPRQRHGLSRCWRGRNEGRQSACDAGRQALSRWKIQSWSGWFWKRQARRGPAMTLR